MITFLVPLLLIPVSVWAESADLQVSSYTWSPDPIVHGGVATFTLTVQNNGPDPSTGSALTINLPANATYLGNASGCTPSAGNTVLTCPVGALAMANNATVSYTATGGVLDVQATSATIVDTTVVNSDANPSNNTLSKLVTSISGADLTVLKTGPAAANAGDIISFTLTPHNAGPDPATLFRVTDNLPAGVDFTYQSAGGAGWICGQSGTTVTCDYGGAGIASGADAPAITVTGRVITTAGTISNGAAIASSDGLTGDPLQGNNTAANVVVTVAPATALQANKTMTSGSTGSTSVFLSGETVTLRLSATNNGPRNATGVSVSDTVPAAFAIGALPAGCSAVGETVTCTVGALNSGVTSAQFAIPLTAPVVAGATAGSNSATVTRTTPAVGANQGATVNYTVTPPFAHLTLAKTKTPTPAYAGDNITSTITVANAASSTSAATGTVTVVDTLSDYPNETYVSAAAPWSCVDSTAVDNKVTCSYTIPTSLAVGAALPDLVITTRVAPAYGGGTLSNTACTGQGYSSHTPADNGSSCATRGVIGTPRQTDLAIAKTVSDTVIDTSEASVTYTLTITNNGPNQADTVMVSDPLPLYYGGPTGASGGSVTVSGGLGAGESCSAIAATVNCTLRNLASGAGRTITVSLNRPFLSGGPFTNTATVSSPDTVETIPGNNTAQATVNTVAAITDVTVSSVVASLDPVKAGVQEQFTVSVKNLGPNPAAGVEVEIPVDTTRVSLVSGSITMTGSGGSCIAGQVMTNPAWPGGTPTGIRCTGFTLAGDESRQIVFRVIPLYPYTWGTYTSDARISTSSFESDAGNNNGSKTVTVINPQLDMSVTKQETLGYDPDGTGPLTNQLYDPVAFGDQIKYLVIIRNNGPSQATQVTLTDTFTPPAGGYTGNYVGAVLDPANSSYTPINGITCTSAGTVTCYLGSGAGDSILPPNSAVGLVITFGTGGAVPTGSLTYSNSVAVSSLETLAGFDSMAGNNGAVETTTVLPKTDLYILKGVSASPVEINQSFNYTLTIGNLGTSDAAGVRVTDPLPTGFVMVGNASTIIPAASGFSLVTKSCSGPANGANGTISCDIGPIPLDASGADTTKQVVITIPVKALYPYAGVLLTNIPNTATVAPLPGTSLDLNYANNSATANVQVRETTIAGTVYSDNDRNEIINPAGTEGINAVTLTLSGTDSYGNTIPNRTTTTAGAGVNTGTFRFDRLPPGTYQIVETQPGSYYDRFETAGTAGGTVPDAFVCDGTANCGSAAALNTISAIPLPANTAATGYVFQEYRRAQLSGYTYHDANNDGDRATSGETGIANLSNHITLSGNAYNGVNVCTLVTCTVSLNGSGLYSYGTLPPSDGTGYTIRQNSLPAGYLDGKDQAGDGVGNVLASSAGRVAPETLAGVTLAPNQNKTEHNFGELLPATISGYVFIDNNANATRDAGETSGMTGITVTLSGSDDLGNGVSLTSTTAANGSYSFTGLRPSDAAGYTVTETPPSGVTHTGAQAGSKGGGGAGAGAGNVAISAIPIVSSDNASGYNFGESGQGLSGFVYIDSNNNAVKNSGEPGISGVQVTLSGHTDTGVDVCVAISPNPCTVTTIAGGAYSFAGLPASDLAGYALTEQPQGAAPLTNYADGADSLGTIAGSGRGAAGSDTFTAITLVVGETGINYNFGELGARLGGSVYYDANGNNGRDGGETGIGSVTLTLSGATASGAGVCSLIPSCSITTDGNGDFLLTDLPASNGAGYTLTETQPVNYGNGSQTAGSAGGVTTVANIISGMVLTPGSTSSGNLFGERLGSLSGTVYHDINNNGSQNGGETGISGVAMVLSGSTASGADVCTLVTCSASTDVNGTFTYRNLPASAAGGYTITETQPVNYLDGRETAGSSGGTVDNSSFSSAAPLNRIVNIILSGGTDAGNYLFGERLGSLGGVVYHDANNNGAQDGGETGISGVSVGLAGTDAAGNPVSQTVTTDTNGIYNFSNLPAANVAGYTLTETQPVNYADGLISVGTSGGTSGLNVITAIQFAAGSSATGYLFGEQLGSLTGSVYLDSNGNGSRDAGEPGISGVTVTLNGTDGGGAAVNLGVVSDASGAYSFTNLPTSNPAGYILTETQPVTYADGLEQAGSLGGTAGAAGTSIISAIPFTAGAIATGYLFGEQGGALTGVVYNDSNNNSSQDGGEPGIGGVTVTLTGTDVLGVVVNHSTTTNGSGLFSFSDLPTSNPGGYTLAETQPITYGDGMETAGNLGGSPGAVGTSIISGINLPAGGSSSGYLFGERLASLSGSVYHDANNNGVIDGGEAGISGVVITLTGIDAAGVPLSRTTTTNGSGLFSLSDLPAGNGGGYTLTETQPATYADGIYTVGSVNGTLSGISGGANSNTISGIQLVAGGTGSGYLFGERLGGLSGMVYHDANNNGARDPGEAAIPGITITLSGRDAANTPITVVAISDPSGQFSFADLPASDASGYTLSENQPATYADGLETVGFVNGVPRGSSGAPGTSVISAIVYPAGATGAGYLFGEQLGSLAGSVFHDINNNGLQEAGEAGIAGVGLTLAGTDALGAAVNRNVTSNGSGIFIFQDLPASGGGGYTISESQPVTYADGKEIAGTAAGTVGAAGTSVISGISLAAGFNATGYQFGELLGNLTGTVYYDANNNGAQNAGESGIAGVTITLTGSDAGGEAVNLVATTGSSGLYQFNDLPASNPAGYTLTETQPPTHADGIETPGSLGGSPGAAGTSVISGIVYPAGSGAAGYLFGELLGTLSGAVYIDGNNNGLKDPAEPGIGGVTVTLTGSDALNTAVNRSVVSDASGNYSFADLPAGNGGGYTLTETQPTAYADGKETAGTLGGTPGAIGSSVISGIPFVAGAAAGGYLFGERGGSISGTVFHDGNNNGIQDAGETGISGVTLALTGSDSSNAPLTLTLISDASGNYTFADLPASNGAGYTLSETQPVTYADGRETPGIAGGVGGATGTSVISAIVLSAGVDAGGYLFGELLGGLSGLVYHDVNDNGIWEAGEAGIANVTITLTGTDAGGTAINRSALTDGSGAYSFANLPASNPAGYTLTETQPLTHADGKESAGSLGGIPGAIGTSVISGIVYPAGADATVYLFGELMGSLSGSVYYDANNNAVKDAGEAGIAAVTLTLSGTDALGAPVTLTALSDGAGNYTVTNLPAGNPAGYTLSETQPANYADGKETPGSLGGTSGPAGTSVISGIVAPAGVNASDYLFGELLGSITGTVYLDANDNGSRDTGELPIAGVTIALSGTDASGAAISRTTLSADDGSYGFADLLPGSYTLAESQPLIYEDGRETAGSNGGIVDNSSFSRAPAQNRISAVALNTGDNAAGYLFGERPGLTARVSGTVWYNSISRDHTRQAGEPGLAGWIVEALQGGVVRGTATTRSDGSYEITTLPAGYGYELRFRHPVNNALYGDPLSQDPDYTDSVPDLSAHTIANLTLRSGGSLTNQNLPVDPSGVVYDSITRIPLSGATVTISGPAGFDAAVHLFGGVGNRSQVTDSSGFYQFLLLPGTPAGAYNLAVNGPPGYVPGASAIIPPTAGPFNPGPGPGNTAVQSQATAPAAGQATTYYMDLTLNGSSANVVNNHIPVDPVLGGAIRISKTTPLVNVSKGDLVPYTIEATNTLAALIPNIDLLDQLPPGFKYRSGSATLNGVAMEPALSGRMLRWPNLAFSANEKKILKLILVVGSGVGEGEYTNQAWAINNIVNTQVSNIGEATVRIVPDPTFDCTDIIGKVFDDRNANGYQEDGEPGIANARLATARGWLVTSDADGRFHVACAAIPQADRGSNFVMKLDERTLPSGFRVTTENPRTVRATRGKMVKLNFGATIHRVVRVEVGDAAFQGDGTKLLPDWAKRFDDLPAQLRERPSVVRLAYRVENGNRDQARQRLDILTATLRRNWEALNCCYPLSIEQELVEVSR